MDKNKNKCCEAGIETGEGISLLTRLLPLLDPARAPIDPYSTQDILVFAKHYADLVRFYDLGDAIDWVDFETGTITRPCNEAPPSSQQQQEKGVQPDDKKELVTWKEFFYKDIAVVVAS